MNLDRKKKFTAAFIFFLLLIFILIIFKPSAKHELSFRELTNRLFFEDITTDTLSLHYTLAHPHRYFINSYPLTLPKYSKENLKQTQCKIENSLLILSNMDTSTLPMEELYCHTLLKDYFLLQKKGFSYTYLEEYFSPSSGIIVNYPVLMAEYTFRSEKDVTDYLTLLAHTGDYFSCYFEFQKERAQKGYYLASASLEEIIKQCDTIITKESLQHQSHFLQLTFHERLASLVEKNILSKKAALKYMDKNNELLKNVVLPSYQNLKDSFLSLQSNPQPLQGLYQKEQGKEYYQWLVQKQIGTSLSIPDILRKLEEDFEDNLYTFRDLQEQITNYNNYNDYLEMPFPLTDKKEILKLLQAYAKEDFPPLTTLSDKPVYTTIKSVSNSMEEFLSPAFYLIPPIDDIGHNTIYINNLSTPKGLDLFTTLAHEGYPGHLYQTVYYGLYSKKNNTPLIRHLMNYGGYVEGWAIYSEFYSYHYATKLYPKELQEFYSLWHELLLCDQKLQLAVLSILDIHLHYYDDSMETAKEILNQYGITDEITIKNIHRYILEEPGNYLKYYMGYLLLMDIKEAARVLMGTAYTDMKFHEFILNAGPSDFDNLQKRLLKIYSG